jgi:glycosyltransferase involved in cell wall biosynthesis
MSSCGPVHRLPLSIVILTHNEEANIAACLDTVVDLAEEIFLVDSGSTDKTLEIARMYSAKIFYHPFSNYSEQRNWAQENLPLSYDWIFHIDADERVSPQLARLICSFFRNPREEIAGLLVRRRIEFWGSHIKHGGLYPTYHCRIFRTDRGCCEERLYDQHFVVHGRTILLEADLVEVTCNSLFAWISKHNRWAQMEASHLLYADFSPRDRCVEPRLTGSPIERRRWFRTCLYEKSPPLVRAFVYFVLRYVFRGGFLDGTAGLVYHVLQGFWFRFYVDACLYELRRRSESHPR